MANTYMVTVWNTVTSQYEETAVPKAVYDEYRRGEWRISKSNDKHAAKETPFSALIGGEDGGFENFHEFMSDERNPGTLVEDGWLTGELQKAIASLSHEDQRLIEALFFKGMSERDYANQLGVYHNAVHKRKIRILSKIKKFLEK